MFKICKHFVAKKHLTYANRNMAEGAVSTGQVTCCSGSQHASVVDAH